MERLEVKIERFLRSGEGDFNTLALELFGYQYARNLPYQTFCRAQGQSPETVKTWEDIPAVTVHAFKSAELTTVLVSRAAAVFESSRTTGQIPSRHYLRDLMYYQASLQAGFKRWVLPEGSPRPFFILAPSPAESPRSSLSWMLEVVMRKWGSAESRYFVQRGRLDDFFLMNELGRVQTAGQPVVLLGTTLAFLALFEACQMKNVTFPLAEGTVLMDTGGMKSQRREITRESFLDQARRYLGVAEAQCINEYGMCELSSQFYSRGRSPVKKGPAWVRVRAIDPLSGVSVRNGELGLLRFCDLANVDSVLAIQTEDLGTIEADGFQMLGRAEGAELRGCSLQAEANFR